MLRTQPSNNNDHDGETCEHAHDLNNLKNQNMNSNHNNDQHTNKMINDNNDDDNDNDNYHTRSIASSNKVCTRGRVTKKSRSLIPSA
jgi:hypothetical protein